MALRKGAFVLLAVLLLGGCSGEGSPALQAPGAAGAGEFQPDESQPDESQHDESQPDEFQPDESQPDESQPDESNSGKFPATPEDVIAYLQAQKLRNGDIYLENAKVHINIVGLTPEIMSGFAAKYTGDTYELHNVEFTAAELIAVQQELADSGLMARLKLYGSTVDIIRNRLVIDLPDDALEAAEAEIGEHLGSDMLLFAPTALGEPHVTGTIVEIASGSREQAQILIQEPGQPEPTYWFSFDEYSKIYEADGRETGAGGIRQGQQVKIWSTGTINSSLPAQGTVRRLELVEQ
ncbi:DUF3221 domain-containing protein [Paenibacillus tengchongensis]|uniref:DUF3221 domain-containing protein n=1 Tax=Paenibacillus tengchongensis TaxID=2608684 RepID=UPI00165218ED|nr:DUF3221 domain-containing protein [Paenibacillus tengchongensis]